MLCFCFRSISVTKVVYTFFSNDEQQLKERIVTIMGPVENVTKAAMHVLESIQNDPHIKDHTSV